jgi:hypothetical protein
MFRHNSGMSSLHQNKEEGSYQYTSVSSFQGEHPRSFDFSPLDYYMWGHLNTTCNDVGTFETVRQSMIRCARLSLGSGGGYFEYLFELWFCKQ